MCSNLQNIRHIVANFGNIINSDYLYLNVKITVFVFAPLELNEIITVTVHLAIPL